MEITTVVLGNLETNCYLLNIDGHIAVIDPGTAQHRLFDELRAQQGTVEYILLTHGHFDHIGGVNALKQAYPKAEVVINVADREMLCDERLNCSVYLGGAYRVEGDMRCVCEGDTLQLGDKTLRVLHTPGHSMGSTCYHIEDTLFCGDTIFYGGYGRTDLYGGDGDALISSLRRITLMEPKTRLLCGHGPETTVARESARYGAI